MNDKELISACYEAARAYQIVDGDIKTTVGGDSSGIFINGNASFSANSSLDIYYELDFTSLSSFDDVIMYSEYNFNELNEVYYDERAKIEEEFLDRSNYVFSEDFIYCNILNRQIEQYENSVRILFAFF